jgi:lipoic acid synthetase
MTPPTAELVQIDLSPRKPVKKPEWLKARAPMGDTFHNLKKLARELNLNTVCESAQCPNIGECWNHKTATFMMLGNLCTRRCGFCAVPKGRPEPIDHDEPRRVAYAVAQLGIAHAVITSVNRDDDNLGAATAFVNVIQEIRRQAPECQVEVLTPDFQGVDAALRLVVEARPEILNHNIETVPRLYRVAKSGGRYERSLAFLANAKTIAAEKGHTIVTKTGIIVGMGEEMHELLKVFRDLADRKVDILTVGQYLRPSRDHLPMARYYTPDEFAFLKHEAMGMGFRHVESGPLVRSSYHAHEQAQSTGLK